MKKLVIAAVLTCAAGPAMAQFTFIPPAKPAPEIRRAPEPVEPRAAAVPVAEPQRRYSMPADTAPAVGFGDNVPLSVALIQIVPPSWRIDLPRDKAMTPVSWKGGDAWPKTAEEVVRGAGLDPVWQTGVLAVRSASSPAVPQKEPAALSPAPAQPMLQSAAATPEPPVQQPADASRKVWKVEPGTYQETLRAWASEAGWNIFFFDPDIDYAIETPATFTGDFRFAARALTRAFRNVSRPPSITFHCETVTPECSTQTIVVRSSSAREN